jgi:hypothetical protein
MTNHLPALDPYKPDPPDERDGKRRADEERWNRVADELAAACPGTVIRKQIAHPGSIGSTIRSNKCCDVVMIGHRGGPSNLGELQAFLEDMTKIKIPCAYCHRQMASLSRY